jgi:hypothetical protein
MVTTKYGDNQWFCTPYTWSGATPQPYDFSGYAHHAQTPPAAVPEPTAAAQVSSGAGTGEESAPLEWFDDMPGVDGDRLRELSHWHERLGWYPPFDIGYLFSALHSEYRRAQYLRDLLDRVAACAVCVCGTEEGFPDQCPVCEAAGVPL